MWPFSKRRADAEPEPEQRGTWTAFEDIRLAAQTYAGVSVTESSAVNLAAVYRCVSLNAETIASLPLDCLVKRDKARLPYKQPDWLTKPNPFQTLPQFVAETVASLDIDGNCFWLKATDRAARLVGLSILSPTAVTPEMVDLDGVQRRVYRVSTKGGTEVYADSEIVHIRGLTLPGELRGLSPIKSAQQTIGIGMAAERFGANFFGNGATMTGVIVSPGTLTQEQADRLRESFGKRHGGVSKSHAVGVLSGGADWKPLSVNPEEAQFLETRRYTDTQIANLFGCPPEFVTDAEGAKGYVTSLNMRLRMWNLTGLNPRMVRIENALSDLLPDPAYVRFNRNALLQMDPEQRVAFYAAGQQGQWLTRNEIRALEDMNPIPGGDEMLASVQWQPDDGPPGDDIDTTDGAAASGLFDEGGQA